MNPWLLNWRTLATDVSCHLQDLLEATATQRRFLPRCVWRKAKRRRATHDSLSSASAARCILWDTRSSRSSHGGRSGRTRCTGHAGCSIKDEREVIALLGLRLTPCQWKILRLLLAHPLLSDEELAAFLHLQRRSVRCLLYELHQLGCLEPIVTSRSGNAGISVDAGCA